MSLIHCFFFAKELNHSAVFISNILVDTFDETTTDSYLITYPLSFNNSSLNSNEIPNQN